MMMAGLISPAMASSSAKTLCSFPFVHYPNSSSISSSVAGVPEELLDSFEILRGPSEKHSSSACLPVNILEYIESIDQIEGGCEPLARNSSALPMSDSGLVDCSPLEMASRSKEEIPSTTDFDGDNDLPWNRTCPELPSMMAGELPPLGSNKHVGAPAFSPKSRPVETCSDIVQAGERFCGSNMTFFPVSRVIRSWSGLLQRWPNMGQKCGNRRWLGTSVIRNFSPLLYRLLLASCGEKLAFLALWSIPKVEEEVRNASNAVLSNHPKKLPACVPDAVLPCAPVTCPTHKTSVGSSKEPKECGR
ncbi:hypothetical protein Nepgr_023269 [Nepenthes gracilis]|uniref:Uncharacterized protein n=1 Tax=Nepenthes gracilis TaxID=150966 RepID=A0AAD3T295_NEPGR|nr:hypothetical protein Nepgr_023269 [Nepenthes gracilis]